MPSDSKGGSVLSAPSGTAVGVQTVCIVVKTSSDGLRQNKSLMIATADRMDDDAASPPRSGATRLTYPVERSTEVVEAVPPGSRTAGILFPFQCLVRDEAPEDDFLDELRRRGPPTDDAGGWTPSDDDLEQGGAKQTVPPADDKLTLPEGDEQPVAPPFIDARSKEACIIDSLSNNALRGMNCHVLSVGGSGTAKADRMLHPDDGLVPRFIHRLFEEVESAAEKDVEAFRKVNRTVSVSIVECFAEEFADLLTIPVAKEPPGVESQFQDGGRNGVASALRAQEHAADTRRSVSFATDVAVVEETAEDSSKDRFDQTVLRAFTANQSVTPSSTGLRLRQHPELGPVIEGAQELQILSVNDFLHIARGAIARRCSSGVKTNRYSHLVLKLTFRQAEVGAAAALTSVVTFVDTATAIRVPSSIPKAKKVQQSTNGFKRMITSLSEICASASSQVEPDALGVPTREDEARIESLAESLVNAKAAPANHPRAPSSASVPNSSMSAVSLLAKESALTQLIAEAFLGNSFTILMGSVLDPSSIPESGSDAMLEEGAQQTLVTLKLVSKACGIATRVLPNFSPVEAKATAIRDEIKALKEQLSKEQAGDAEEEEAQGELQTRLQSYEDQLDNLQSTFEEKVSSHAELEAACLRQRQALDSMQSVLESRRKQAEELDAFASEIDELMEQHRRNEVRLRREREAVAEREREAARIKNELSIMAHEQSTLEREIETVQAARLASRQSNIAAFFRSLLEQEKRKREIAAFETVNKQLRTQCALQQAKVDKIKRRHASLAEDVEQLRQVHELQTAKKSTLEDDPSVGIADEQMAAIVELTQKIVAKTVYTKQDLAACDTELADSKKQYATEHDALAGTVRSLRDSLNERESERAALTTTERKLGEQQDELTAQRAALIERQGQLRARASEHEAKLRELDQEQAVCREQFARARLERDSKQDELLTITTRLESLRADIEVWAARRDQMRSTYNDLCASASQRISVTTA